jgi:hypothetical protein
LKLPEASWAAAIGVAAATTLAAAMLAAVPRPGPPAPIPESTTLTLAAELIEGRAALTIAPAAPGPSRFELAATDPAGRALAAGARVTIRATRLDGDHPPASLDLPAAGDGRFVATGDVLTAPGWWEIEVAVRRPGRRGARAVFPLLLGRPRTGPGDLPARALLVEAADAVRRARFWKQIEQIADGAGGVVVTRYEFAAPDRMRYVTSSGETGITVGRVHSRRRRGENQWDRTVLADSLDPFSVISPRADMPSAVLGRTGLCGADPCRVVLWRDPGGLADYALWIASRDRRPRRLLMVAPAHYMTTIFEEYDVPIELAPPR